MPWLRSLRPMPTADLNDRDAERMGIKRATPSACPPASAPSPWLPTPTLRVKPGTVHMYHGYREADVNSIIPPEHNDPYSGSRLPQRPLRRGKKRRLRP